MKPTLKLIETNDTPKIGDLVRHWSGLLSIIESKEELKSIKEDIKQQQCKVVKPYGISDEEIKVGDKVYCRLNNCIMNTSNKVDVLTYNKYRKDSIEQHSRHQHYFKVVILPEQFNNQDIVDLGLKDGDELPLKSYKQYDEPDNPDSSYTIISPLYDGTTKKVLFTKPYDYTKLPMNPHPNLPNWMDGDKEVGYQFTGKKPEFGIAIIGHSSTGIGITHSFSEEAKSYNKQYNIDDLFAAFMAGTGWKEKYYTEDKLVNSEGTIKNPDFSKWFNEFKNYPK